VAKAELIEQVKAMTEEEAARVKLIYAPDWPSKTTAGVRAAPEHGGATSGPQS
jgi:hypothetical protein